VLLIFVPELPAVAQTKANTGLVVASIGEVSIRHGNGPRTASAGVVLHEGDTLVVASGASCRGFDPSGRPFDLPGPAETVFSGTGTDGTLASIRSWIARQLTEWAGSTRDRPLLTRSARSWEVATPAPATMLPANDGEVRPGRVRLVWSAIPGVERYEATWTTPEGIETTHTVTGTNLVVDGLSPGGEYLWRVRPAVEGWPGNASWSTFRVLKVEEERELDRAVEGLDDLRAGVLLLSSGLHEEAILRFDAAMSEVPNGAARLWRARAFSDLGLYKQACEDLQATAP
jgi:hypothetical protein